MSGGRQGPARESAGDVRLFLDVAMLVVLSKRSRLAPAVDHWAWYKLNR